MVLTKADQSFDNRNGLKLSFAIASGSPSNLFPSVLGNPISQSGVFWFIN